MRGTRLYVRGRNALFTRPESKAERVSYDVPTPSAARGILEAIHWKPAFRWVIDRIHVLNPIRFESIRRNEVSVKAPKPKTICMAARNGQASSLVINAAEVREQRMSLMLADVAYVIEAHPELTERAGDDTVMKHLAIFERRAAKGQCFQQPCLGCREFPAWFSLLPEGAPLPASALVGDAPRDLGWMLYDIDYANDMASLFYRPRLEAGIINVERDARETLCRHI